jgi:hypothetical protein
VPTQKVIILLAQSNTVQSVGWGETFFQEGANPDAVLGNALLLGTQRMKMSPPDVKCVGVRVSDSTQFRSTRFIAGGASLVPGGAQLPAQGLFAAAGALEFDDALLIRLEATTLHRRALLLRGMPNSIVNTDGSYNRGNAAFQAEYNAFSSLLRGQAGAGNWEIYAIDPAQPATNFSALATGPTGNSIVITMPTGVTIQKTIPPNPPAPVQAGDFIQIRRVRGAVGINGVWKVAMVGGTTFINYTTYSRTRPALFPFNYQVPSSSTVRFWQRVVAIIDKTTDERMVNRKTGRPFGQLRGRRAIQR